MCFRSRFPGARWSSRDGEKRFVSEVSLALPRARMPRRARHFGSQGHVSPALAGCRSPAQVVGYSNVASDAHLSKIQSPEAIALSRGDPGVRRERFEGECVAEAR
jgi:hypothetical protein